MSLHCGIIGWGSNGGVGGGGSHGVPSVRWTMSGGKAIPMTGNVFIKPGQSELIFVAVRKSESYENYTCQVGENGGSNNNNKRVIRGIVMYSLRVKGMHKFCFDHYSCFTQ